MTDVFFSYKSEDRERVRLVRDALVDLGFEVFWDQEVPPGTDWDRWIKIELQKARSAIVFWSSNSIHSSNVRQEATIAQDEGKLIQVLLKPLSAEQFPMGLYTTQAIMFADWQGAPDDPNWLKLMREIEERASPKWIRKRLMSLETALRTEALKREMAETREISIQARYTEEVASQKAALLERDEARASLEPILATVESLKEGVRLKEAPFANIERKLSAIGIGFDELRQDNKRMNFLHYIAPLLLIGCPVIAVFIGTHLATNTIDKRNDNLTTTIERIIELEKKLNFQVVQLPGTKALDSRIAELEKELKIKDGLIDFNWIDAAIALKSTRDRKGEQK